MDIKPFSKIFTLGDRHIQDIFLDEVEITEKIDGSQFDFGKINGELVCRSQGQVILFELFDKSFKLAVDYIQKISDKIPDNTIFYCEFLKSPKHNILSYGRVPKNNLICFGATTPNLTTIPNYKELADLLEIESVPVLFKGKIDTIDSFNDMFNIPSVLGGEIEGVVVKNYNRELILGDVIFPIMAGKYVREAFKEKHKTEWKGEFTAKGNFDRYKEGYKSEARWYKAIQHLRDANIIEDSPKEIGLLIKEIQRDIVEEEKENIKDDLWKLFSDEILRSSIRGFPEFYKQHLLNLSNIVSQKT